MDPRNASQREPGALEAAPSQARGESCLDSPPARGDLVEITDEAARDISPIANALVGCKAVVLHRCGEYLMLKFHPSETAAEGVLGHKFGFWLHQVKILKRGEYGNSEP